MQFVTKGPEIPEQLLQAHEEGNLVFFCGAGISTPAGLPGFKKLITELYSRAGVQPDPQQSAAIDSGELDRAIDLLERRTAGGRPNIRKHLPDILCPPGLQGTITSTHNALLTLGQTKDEKARLVTTNFDRLFENAISGMKNTIKTFEAPLLPIPKNKWNGVVYLHGLLSSCPTPEELNQLILSSGDFGRAYLTERWASNFVTQLFSRYTVCFVGYSIDDPVLRYLMDAFAADLLDGETIPQAYAFVGYDEDEKDEVWSEWDAKNVIPILYKKANDHHSLHATLKEWADYYRDQISGKERIIINNAHSKPLLSTQEDNFVGKMLWALSDPSGKPARCFSQLDPIPPIEWLEVFSKPCFGYENLTQFGHHNKNLDKSIKFSLLNRPSPSHCSVWVSPIVTSPSGEFDAITRHICEWMCNHLENPEMLFWITDRGGRPHREFAQMIQKNLSKLSKKMQVFWSLVLANKIEFPDHDLAFFNWEIEFCKQGLTFPLQQRLRDLLAPRLRIYPSYRNKLTKKNTNTNFKDFVNWQIVLGISEPHFLLARLASLPNWKTSLPLFLDDATALLLDTLKLMQELDAAHEKQDLSYIAQPYIHQSSQNHLYQDWTALIELVRDAWLEVANNSPEKALSVAQRWINLPYPTFKRLAFFAAIHLQVVDPKMGLAWLIEDDGWWLWSPETKPEALRLIVAVAPKLNKTTWGKLEKLILKGPPESLYAQNPTHEQLDRIIDSGVSLRLAKAKNAGVLLGKKAQATFESILTKYPNWDPLDELHELSFRFASEFRPICVSEPVPQILDELVDWLSQQPSSTNFGGDGWQVLCASNIDLALSALERLAKSNQWPPDRWREALSTWSRSKLVALSWSRVYKLLSSASDKFIGSISHSLSWWLDEAVRSIDVEESASFIAISRRILESNSDETLPHSEEPVHSAINHALGITTKAVLFWAFKQKPNDGHGLEQPIKELLSKMCETKFESFRYARLELAANGIALFRLDPKWSQENLLPLFNWNNLPNEAANTWMGFLSGRHDYLPLLQKIKDCFLGTSSHIQSLGRYSDSYASLLTWVAINPQDSFSREELNLATMKIGKKGLVTALETILSFLRTFPETQKDSGRANFWQHRVHPYFRFIWPKSKALMNDEDISNSLAEVCVHAEKQFPSAVDLLRPLLNKTESCGAAIDHLNASNLCSEFPKETLALLDCLVGNKLTYGIDYLKECLGKIGEFNPQLLSSREFIRLMQLVR